MSDSISGSSNVVKPVATVSRQLETLRSHKVSFERCDEEEAARYLTDNTYFFKLKAFDKKFERNEAGEYASLDFAYLQDIATVDFHIRRLVSELTSDIEHALKIRFNVLLMRRTSEDGYAVVRDYERHETEYRRSRYPGEEPSEHDIFQSFKSNAYTQAIIEKYGDNPPAWLIWEVCPLNETISFYRYFLHRIGYKDTVFALLDGVRILRNAAAHNNCLLTAPAYTVNRTDALQDCLTELLDDELFDEQREMILELSQCDPLVHDFACVICCHINLVKSRGISSRARGSALTFMKRAHRNMEWYRSALSGCAYLCKQLDAICTLLMAFRKYSPERESGDTLSAAPQNYSQRRYRHRHMIHNARRH
ncbi:Abi family protein [Bifidobacterium breve]|uniref:Abi family protein n=1 Tax=Bifidobacterium breve TaxID=1685 RepID=UPI0032DE550A